MLKGHVCVVVGAQYGSEGKGAIVQHIAGQYSTHVRVGGPNAGHTVYDSGREWKMQMVPCGWLNREANLFLGAGALIDVDLFLREVHAIAEVDPTIMERTFVDTKAGILDHHHHAAEGGVEGELHARIGSTGEGVGAARHARMARDSNHFRQAKDVPELQDFLVEDSAGIFRRTVVTGDNVLLEGTQGSGLSLIHGPWPFVTSNDTNAAQIMADCGVAPDIVKRVILVARTYPIRVAGNSGPLKGELDWDEMSRRVGHPVVERTTVTRKIRRVGAWDDALLDRAVTLNGPTEIALTFVDYLNANDTNATTFEELSGVSQSFIYSVSARFRNVTMVGVGRTKEDEADNRPIRILDIAGKAPLG